MLKVDGLRTQLWLRFILKKSSKERERERERERGGKEGERGQGGRTKCLFQSALKYVEKVLYVSIRIIVFCIVSTVMHRIM